MGKTKDERLAREEQEAPKTYIDRERKRERASEREMKRETES